MKAVGTIFFIWLFSIQGSYAQTGFYGQHAEFQSYSALGIYTPDINSEYLFLVDDDFQNVLANPAKAMLFDRPFVATTIGSVPNSPVNAGIILPGKWVVTASFLNATETDASDYQANFFNEVSYTQLNDLITESEERLEIQNGDQKEAFNSSELRVIKTRDKGDNEGRAFGIFLGFTQSDLDGESNSDLYWTDILTRTRNDTLVQVITNDASRLREVITAQKRNLYRGGLEYYRASEKSESAQKLYIQFTDFDREESIYIDRSDTTTNVTPAISTNQVNVRYDERRVLTDAVPFGAVYEGYFNRKAEWLGDDFIFLKARGRYSRGELNFNLREIDRITIYQNGTETFTSSTSLNFGYTENETWFLSGEISPGYAIRKTGDNYSLFTGLNPFVRYSRADDYYLWVEAAIREFSESSLNAGFRMPLYGAFSVNEWLSFWGGGSIQYHYIFYTMKESQAAKVSEENTSLPLEYSRSQTSTDNRIDKNVFAGMRFQHKSGLTVNTNFQGDISRVNFWLISVGYAFN